MAATAVHDKSGWANVGIGQSRSDRFKFRRITGGGHIRFYDPVPKRFVNIFPDGLYCLCFPGVRPHSQLLTHFSRRNHMIKGDGDRMTREYFRRVEQILRSRGLSGRKASDRIGRSLPYFSRAKTRSLLRKSWPIVEEVLGLSPRTIFAVLADEIEYDQILAGFGPQDEPGKTELLAEFGKLSETIQGSTRRAEGEIGARAWSELRDLEHRRFKYPESVEAQCQEIVGDAVARSETLRREEAVVAVGAQGVWCTLRRNSNDPGSAVQGLAMAIQCSVALDSSRLQARLLQRATYLLTDVDQFVPAERMADRAIKLYSDTQDIEGLGTALIDTGLVAAKAGNLEVAEARVLSGVDLLGADALGHRYKASAYQLVAKSSALRGELDRSIHYLNLATSYSVANEEQWASIRWCAGNIQFQLGFLGEAEVALREALQIYLRADRVAHIVMLLLDLATVKVAEEQIEEIPLLAVHLEPYLDRLPAKDQLRMHVEEAHACLLRARHVQTFERFKKIYQRAFATRKK